MGHGEDLKDELERHSSQQLSFAQEKSHIEVFMRPLSEEASALVFLSRRTDMPYRYSSSLGRLKFPSSRLYEVSAQPPAAQARPPASCLPAGALLGVVLTPRGFLRPLAEPTGPLQVLRVFVCASVSSIAEGSRCVQRRPLVLGCSLAGPH